MLDWPIRWSSLHGVAIITTPVFKLIVDSTALAATVEIDRDGPNYPEEGVRGITFPFKNTRKMNVLKREEYTENGFSNRAAMLKGHGMILESLLSPVGDVLDLGCGNGVLLEKIGRLYPNSRLLGVEKNIAKRDKARERLEGFNSNIKGGDISETNSWSGDFGTILIAEQRLEESSEPLELKRLLQSRTKVLIVYNYSTMSLVRTITGE